MTASSRARKYRLPIFLMLLAVLMGISSTASADDEGWSAVVEEIHTVIDEIPGHYEAKDQTAVEASIRRAYYEIYQVSGLQDQITHRLGRDEAAKLPDSLLEVREATRAGTASVSEIAEQIDQIHQQLLADVEALNSSEAISDRWTRVATAIADKADEAVTAYLAGDASAAYHAATDAYLGHYEADGLEKATLAYISNGRVSQVEAQFRELRVSIRDDAGEQQVVQAADTLTEMVLADAAELDDLGSSESIGWSGFLAAFFVLLREGVEALLVVAAVVTYLLKADRRHQLPGVYIGIGAALAASAGLALLFNLISASVSSGMGQEVLEGVTGIAAAIMLIYVSSWILSKSEGQAWHQYLNKNLQNKTQRGAFALWTVVFLAVFREGAETILFFQPILSATQTTSDRMMVWLGVAAAAVLLVALFLLVWLFGIKLPLKPFFRWTSLLLALLSVTITGGAIKEFQDAMLIPVTPLPGVPEITWLGLYPTAQTVAAQLLVAGILIVLAILQVRRARSDAAADDPGDSTPETPRTLESTNQ